MDVRKRGIEGERQTEYQKILLILVNVLLQCFEFMNAKNVNAL